jgi:hypothetical protein
MISYSLYKNPVKKDEKEYRALVKAKATLNLEDVIDHMMRRGSTVTKPDAIAVLTQFFAVLLELLLEGFRISTPVFNMGVSIRGNFKDTQDAFDSRRHKFEVVISVRRPFRKTVQARAQPHKKMSNQPKPVPISYINPNNDAGDDVLTPGGGAHLIGYDLNFDPADPKQGIFLLTAGQAPRRVEVILRNVPRELIFLVPADLPAGAYTVEVRSRFGQKIRSGRLETVLRVD